MSELFIPKRNYKTQDATEIASYLQGKGVAFTRWQANLELSHNDSMDTILKAYEHELAPYMQAHGHQSADVINVHSGTENIEQIRQKFLKEHTHSEDEVRFFVDGSGKFWFHFDDGEVACVTCERNDFLSVPAGVRHWFDLAPGYMVKAIRIFTSTSGWTPEYTHSGVDEQYNK